MPDYRSILITGASSGIGAALALHLAGPSVHLWLSGRDLQRLEQVAAGCRSQGAVACFKQLDVVNQEEMSNWIIDCNQQVPLDLVVANAGISIGPKSDFIEDRQQLDDLLAININGVINTVYPALSAMGERKRGQIALVSSLAGYRGMPTAPAYSASKNFVKSWGVAIAPHAQKHGVSISIICPGFVKSRITAKNTFPMPMLMSADKAASIVIKGLSKKKLIIAFPWPPRLAMWFLSALPSALANKFLGRLPQKK